MASNKKLMIFIFGLCPIIPISSNFAYGIVLITCLWFVFFLGLLGNYLVKLFEIKRFDHIFLSMFMILGTALFNSLLEGLFPIIQDAIQVYIYILTFSYIVFLSIKDYYTDSESLDIPIWYSILIFVLSSFRELFAFGSISFPVFSGFISIRLPFFSEYPPFRFLGSTAGTFIILGLIIWLYFSITKVSLILNLREE